MLNALSHWGWRLKVMIVDFIYLWRLAHDKWGVYAKADRRVAPDLMGDDGRRMPNTKRVGLPVGTGLTAQTGERGQAPAYDEAFRMSLLKFDLHRDPVLLKAQLGNLGSVTAN